MSENCHIPRLAPAARLLLYAGIGVIIVFLLLRLATGFYHFLATNLPRISANADTLIPGSARISSPRSPRTGCSRVSIRDAARPGLYRTLAA